MLANQFDILTRRLIAGLVPACARWSRPDSGGRISHAGAWLHADVPLHLSALHAPRLVNGIWAQLQVLLKRPTQTLLLPNGAIAVQVLGTAVFVKGPSGMLHPFLWEAPDRLQRLDPKLVMVTEIPYGSIWLRRLVLQALQLRNRHFEDAAPAMLNEYVSWLVGKLERRIRSRHGMRNVRHRIASALAIDLAAWRLCHRMQLGSPLDSKTSVHQYNVCVLHREALLEIERVAPQATGIFGALCTSRDFPVAGEPLQRLKGFLRTKGLNSRTWLLVIRDGGFLLRMARHFYRGATDSIVLDTLQIMEGLGLARMLPPWLFQAIYGEWGHAGARRTGYARHMKPSIGNLRHLVRCLLQWKHAPTALQEQQVAEVVNWISEPETSALARAQRQRGWDYLARQAREYHRRFEENAAARGVTWLVPFDTLTIGKLSLVSISSSLQLLDEGRTMSNCVSSFQDKCLSGTQLLVSVYSASGSRIATASYLRAHPGWELEDAKGPMNRTLPPEVMRRLRKCAALIPQPSTAPAMDRGREARQSSCVEASGHKE